MRCGNGTMAYNAAVAAFRVFGDGEFARQYLRIAAKINPIILTKILAKEVRLRDVCRSELLFY